MKYELRPSAYSIVVILVGELIIGLVVAFVTVFIQAVPDEAAGRMVYRVGYVNSDYLYIIIGITVGLLLLTVLFLSQRGVYYCRIEDTGVFICLGWRRRRLDYETVTFMDITGERLRIFTRREKFELHGKKAQEIYDTLMPKVRFN